MQLTASFVQREVARLAVTEGLFFQILTFLRLCVTMARKFLSHVFHHGGIVLFKSPAIFHFPPHIPRFLRVEFNVKLFYEKAGD